MGVENELGCFCSNVHCSDDVNLQNVTAIRKDRVVGRKDLGKFDTWEEPKHPEGSWECRALHIMDLYTESSHHAIRVTTIFEQGNLHQKRDFKQHSFQC